MRALVTMRIDDDSATLRYVSMYTESCAHRVRVDNLTLSFTDTDRGRELGEAIIKACDDQDAGQTEVPNE